RPAGRGGESPPGRDVPRAPSVAEARRAGEKRGRRASPLHVMSCLYTATTSEIGGRGLNRGRRWGTPPAGRGPGGAAPAVLPARYNRRSPVRLPRRAATWRRRCATP